MIVYVLSILGNRVKMGRINLFIADRVAAARTGDPTQRPKFGAE